MNNIQQEKSAASEMDTPRNKEEKGKCMMCKFVLIFSFIALFLVLVLVFLMRVPAAGSVGF